MIEDVFKLLECTEEGLTDEESARRLAIFGPNKLESEEQNAFLQVGHSLGCFFSLANTLRDSFSASCGTLFRGSWKPPRSLPSRCRTEEGVRLIGKISLVLCCSYWPTLPLDSTKNGMLETRSRLSWIHSHPRPRSSARALGAKSNLRTWFPEI